ncbi:hypothetical protein LCGC14_2493760 [marine sediment metagenome]|uniref:Uncharacterized protein n=1 Tax=marine sediment metagenome TaxID=412755 RepID=A0A0F9DXP3_9ZZZZ
MKKFLKRIWVLILFIVLIGGSFVIADDKPVIPKPSEIVCTCGCDQKAIQCGDHCSVAKELLKKFKGT